MTIPLKDSTAPNAKAALERLNQLKSQLNLAPSPMSLQAPKDMASERASADFDVTALAHLFSGGKKSYDLQNHAYELVKADPMLVVQPPRNIFEFSKEEWREFTMCQIYRIKQLQDQYKHDPELIMMVKKIVAWYSPSYGMRVFVHESLFRNVITMQGTDEQKKTWLDAIDDYRVYGCFAMTELGHSSALRDIETTASFDVDRDVFVIDSPTITSSKWWIGGSAQTSTHAVVIAQTIIKGKYAGHGWFVVQLRDKVTGELMPGIRIVDVGKKHGHQGVDNGMVQFHGVTVPRDHFLQKWAKLERDGTFTPAPDPAVMYATLIPERLALIHGTTQPAGMALMIATRYSIVRRQGHNNEQIMDYQSHYSSLIPQITFIHILRSVSDTIEHQFQTLTAGGHMDPVDYLKHMGDMHATSACIKAFAGWYGCEILETTRRACGGHAYSAYNGISQAINDWGVKTTGAGDNVVLLQQASRIYIRMLDRRLKGHPPLQLKFKSSAHYINDAQKYLAMPTWSVNDLRNLPKNLHFIEEALNAILVKRFNSIRLATEAGKSQNDVLMDQVRVAEMHCATFLFSNAVEKFGSDTAPASVEPSVHVIMRRLTFMWGVTTLYRYSDQGFKESFLTPKHVKDIEELFFETAKSLRSQVIGLTDAFNIPDFVHNSPIGKFDGNVYEDTVLQVPNSVGKAPYHEKYIKPLTSRD